MVKLVTKVLLWLFVMNIGIAFGAGIYEEDYSSPVGQVPNHVPLARYSTEILGVHYDSTSYAALQYHER